MKKKLLVVLLLVLCLAPTTAHAGRFSDLREERNAEDDNTSLKIVVINGGSFTATVNEVTNSNFEFGTSVNLSDGSTITIRQQEVEVGRTSFKKPVEVKVGDGNIVVNFDGNKVIGVATDDLGNKVTVDGNTVTLTTGEELVVATPVATPTPTATATPTPTPKESATPTPKPKATPKPKEKESATPTPTPKPKEKEKATPTPTPTPTATPTPTISESPVPSETPKVVVSPPPDDNTTKPSPTPTTEKTKTGDSIPLKGLFAVLAISGIGVGACLFALRNKRKNK